MKLKAKNRLAIVPDEACYSLTGKDPCGRKAKWLIMFPNGDRHYVCGRHFSVAAQVLAGLPESEKPEARRV